jgi:hypothetical protein
MTPLLVILVLVIVAALPSLIRRFGKHNMMQGRATIYTYLSGPCPQCGSLLEEHDWAMFACTVASEENRARLEEFFNAAKAHDWASLNSFSDWEGSQDDMEAYVVRCSSGGVVFVLWNPFELFDSAAQTMRETITLDQMAEIEKLVRATSWHVASPSAK